MNRTRIENIAEATDRFVCAVGRAASWLCLVMVLVAGVVVTLRYFFGVGWIWLQETVTWSHLCGTAMIIFGVIGMKMKGKVAATSPKQLKRTNKGRL